MRDWYLPLAPVAAIIYFIFFPSQLSALIAWAEQIVQYW
jgi:hypothetical protein